MIATTNSVIYIHTYMHTYIHRHKHIHIIYICMCKYIYIYILCLKITTISTLHIKWKRIFNSLIFICDNNIRMTVRRNKISHFFIISFHNFSVSFHSKTFCQYKTQFGYPVLWRYLSQQI